MSRLVHKILYGGSNKLRPYEVACLEAYATLLTSELGEVATQQIANVDFVHRNTDDRVVNLKYFKKWRQLPRFVNESIELPVCTMRLIHEAKTVRADIYAEEGVLIGINFSNSPKLLIKGRPDNVKLLNDVGAKEPLLAQRPAHVNLEFEARNFLLPAVEDFAEAFVRRLDCPVPDDYRELLRQTNGFEFTLGTFEGTKARQIVWPNTNLQILVEDSHSMIALCVDERASSEVLFLHQPSAVLEPVGRDFIPALNMFAARLALTKATN